MVPTKPSEASAEPAAPRDGKRVEPRAAPDERDALLEQLEAAIAEERQNSAKLRAAVDDLRFKAEILERSYAKQLADARARSGAAEQKLADEQNRLGAIDKEREEATLSLKELRADLARVTAERDLLRKQQFTGNRRIETDADLPASAGPSEPRAPEGTINELMSHPNWLRASRQPAGDTHLDARVCTDEGLPAEDMLAPEVVFPKKSEREES